jgi:hypothetical protein
VKALDMMASKPEMKDEPASDSLDAAKDILAAMSSKDAKALDLALQRHYATCEGKDEDEGYESLEDEDS